MAKKTVTCDVCGIEMNAGDAYWDTGNERDLCAEHYRQTKLTEAKERRDALQSWLDSTHLKTLRELDEEIAKLETPNV